MKAWKITLNDLGSTSFHDKRFHHLRFGEMFIFVDEHYYETVWEEKRRFIFKWKVQKQVKKTRAVLILPKQGIRSMQYLKI